MHVKIDLGYRVAYLVDEQGTTQLATSGVTWRGIDSVLTSWGYARTSNVWETTDILNAIDAVQCTVEPIGS